MSAIEERGDIEVAVKADSRAEELQQMAAEMFDSGGVYLSGPIRCVDDNGKEWREELAEDYPEVTFNSPLDNYDPDEVEILNDPIHLDPESEKEQIVPAEYVMEDKMMIQQSDCVFVGLPDAVARGTMMECMYAYLHDKPFYVWTIDEQEESGWIFEHSEVIDNDRDFVMRQMKDYEPI